MLVDYPWQLLTVFSEIHLAVDTLRVINAGIAHQMFQLATPNFYALLIGFRFGARQRYMSVKFVSQPTGQEEGRPIVHAVRGTHE